MFETGAVTRMVVIMLGVTVSVVVPVTDTPLNRSLAVILTLLVVTAVVATDVTRPLKTVANEASNEFQVSDGDDSRLCVTVAPVYGDTNVAIALN